MARTDSRPSQKAARLRKAVEQFRTEFGYENTVGIDAVVQSDYMSSECSDGDLGAASEGEWRENRLAQGGGDIEVRTKQWRSEKVRDSAA